MKSTERKFGIGAAAVCAALLAGLSGCADKDPGEPQPHTTSSSSTALDIGAEGAVAAALKHAGVDRSEVTFVRSKLDNGDETAEYEIEFTAADMKYEYEIKASDGSVLKFSSESIRTDNSQPIDDTSSAAAEDPPPAGEPAQSPPPETPPQTTQSSHSSQPQQSQQPKQSPQPVAPSSAISEAEAREIAATHAGYTEAQVTFTKTKLDYDDGVAEYDIEFTAENTHYEYEIRESDGRVLEFSAEVVSAPAANTVGITEERAKEIAVKHAGFTAGQVTFIKTELDYDDGRAEYEVEFRANGLEYELKIDAQSGAVLEMEVDD